jgi:hypothetical protein
MKKQNISRYLEFTGICDSLDVKDPRQKAFVEALLELLVLRQMAQMAPTEEHLIRFMNHFKLIVNNWCPALEPEYR